VTDLVAGIDPWVGTGSVSRLLFWTVRTATTVARERER
jgi:hypothetical protein